MDEQKRKPRPYIGVHFECCQAYRRVHKTADGAAYAGHCPRCMRPIRVRVGEGGSNQRFFRAR